MIVGRQSVSRVPRRFRPKVIWKEGKINLNILNYCTRTKASSLNIFSPIYFSSVQFRSCVVLYLFYLCYMQCEPFLIQLIFFLD